MKKCLGTLIGSWLKRTGHQPTVEVRAELGTKKPKEMGSQLMISGQVYCVEKRVPYWDGTTSHMECLYLASEFFMMWALFTIDCVRQTFKSSALRGRFLYYWVLIFALNNRNVYARPTSTGLIRLQYWGAHVLHVGLPVIQDINI